MASSDRSLTKLVMTAIVGAAAGAALLMLIPILIPGGRRR
jgi:hypothetical protein